MSPAPTKTVYLLKAGDQLGVYRVIRPLGAGGMGEVYLVEHQHLRKRYALKILPTDVSEDSTFIDRFRIEARVMADLEHPGIVRVSNFGEDQGRHYLVMDYVEGPDGAPRTLDDELAWGKKLPEHVVLNFALQLCDALEYAHTFPAGAIIHRDLKPGNILLQKTDQKSGPAPVPAPTSPEPELRVKIADFGLARIVGTDYIKAVIDRSTHLTVMPLRPTSGDAQATEINTGAGSTVSLLGTYDYMSPEQKVGSQVDARSDVYSLGLILYRMLTGHKPEGSYDPPSKAGVSRRWDAIMARCLKRELEERYASAAALKKDLLAMKQPRLSQYRLFAGAAVLLLVLAFLGGLALRRPAASPDEPSLSGPVAAAPEGLVIPYVLEVKPVGASLKIERNGALVAERTLSAKSTTVELKPGVYTFELNAAGYRKLVQNVPVGPDQPRKWTVAMTESLGYLRVADADGQQISILNEAGQPVTGIEPEVQGSLRIFKLPVGAYELMVTKPDYEAVSRKVQLVEDVPSEVKVDLLPLPGSLRVHSEVPAELWQGTRRLGETGEWIRKLPAGAIDVQVRRPGYREARLTVDIPPNGEREVTPDPLVAEYATLIVQMEVRGRTVPAEYQPKTGILRVGTNEAQQVELPWRGETRLLNQDLPIELSVEGYDPLKPEVVRLRDGQEQTVLFRMLPLFVKLTVNANVPADIYRLRAGQTAQGWRKFVFGRDIPIGKTGEPLTLDAFVPQQLTVLAEGYEPHTLDIHLVRPGATDEIRQVELKPLPPGP